MDQLAVVSMSMLLEELGIKSLCCANISVSLPQASTASTGTWKNFEVAMRQANGLTTNGCEARSRMTEEQDKVVELWDG